MASVRRRGTFQYHGAPRKLRESCETDGHEEYGLGLQVGNAWKLYPALNGHKHAKTQAFLVAKVLAREKHLKFCVKSPHLMSLLQEG